MFWGTNCARCRGGGSQILHLFILMKWLYGVSLACENYLLINKGTLRAHKYINKLTTMCLDGHCFPVLTRLSPVLYVYKATSCFPSVPDCLVFVRSSNIVFLLFHHLLHVLDHLPHCLMVWAWLLWFIGDWKTTTKEKKKKTHPRSHDLPLTQHTLPYNPEKQGKTSLDCL